MPDLTLTPDRENELKGLVLEMENNNINEEEISEVVNNYFDQHGTEVDVKDSEPIIESDKPDPLEETYLELTKLTEEEKEEATQSAIEKKKQLFDSFNGDTDSSVYTILETEDRYREYLKYLETGEITPDELDISKASRSVVDLKSRQFISSLGYKDKQKVEQIQKNASERLKENSKKVSKFAPLVKERVDVIEPLQKQLESLRLKIDEKKFLGEDYTKDVESYEGLRNKIVEESEGLPKLFKEYIEANKNSLDDAQVADAFNRTYSTFKQIGHAFEETGSDISILASELLFGNPQIPGKYKAGILDFRESKLEERKEEELFRATKLPKPIEAGDIRNVRDALSYGADAIINNSPSLAISALGTITGQPYLAYPLFFAVGAGAKLSEHELVKRGSEEELKNINNLLKKAETRDQRVPLEKRKHNIENALTVEEWKKWLTVGGHGVAELLFERLGTMRIFENVKLLAQGAKDPVNVKKSFFDTSSKYANQIFKTASPFAEGFAIEAGTEGATTLAQNWLDINVLGEEKDLSEGLTDALLQGGIVGGVLQGGGSIASSIVNAYSTNTQNARIAESATRIGQFVEQLLENNQLTPEQKSDLHRNIIEEASKTANIQDEILYRINELTPEEQRKVFQTQAKLDRVLSQKYKIEDSELGEETKQFQLDQVNQEVFQLTHEKNGIVDRILDPTEIQQLKDLNVSIPDVNLNDIKDKLNKRKSLLNNDLSSLRHQLKSNQIGTLQRSEKTQPLIKLIAKNQKDIDAIEKHEAEQLEKTIDAAAGTARAITLEEARAEVARRERERLEKQKYSVKIKDGKVSEVSDKDGNLASPATANKYILEHIPNLDLVSGRTLAQQGFYPRDEQEGADAVSEYSLNPLEIAHTIKAQEALDKENLSTKGYVEDYVAENIRLTKEDYGNYGDPNLIKDISRAWFYDKALALDKSAQEASGVLGVEITPGDIIEIINDNPGNPNEYKPKTSIATLDLKDRFRKITGLNPTPTVINKVIKEGDKQLSNRPELDETAKEALNREAAERQHEFDKAFEEIVSSETSTIPNFKDTSVSKAKITLESPVEIKKAKQSLRVTAKTYGIKRISDELYRAKTKEEAVALSHAANIRGLDAAYVDKDGSYEVLVLDPLIDNGTNQSLLDRAISHLEEIYRKLPKGSVLQSRILPTIPTRAIVGTIIDALKAFRTLYRSGKNLLDSIKESYTPLKDHITEKEWAKLINGVIVKKEEEIARLQEDEHAAYFTPEVLETVKDDINSLKDAAPTETKDYAALVPEPSVEIVEELPPTKSNIELFDMIKGFNSGLSSTKSPGTQGLKQTGAYTAVKGFAIGLQAAKLYEGIEGVEEASEDVEFEDLPEKALVKVAMSSGPHLLPKFKNENTEERRIAYMQALNYMLDIAEGLGIVGLDIGPHTGGQYVIKVLNPTKFNNFIRSVLSETVKRPAYHGLIPIGKAIKRTKFRQNGLDLISNAPEETVKRYKTRNASTENIYAALENTSHSTSVIGRHLLGVLNSPAYQNSNLFTYKDTGLSPEVIEMHKIEDKAVLDIAINQGTDGYTIEHTYGDVFRMYARSFQANPANSKLFRWLNTPSTLDVNNQAILEPMGEKNWVFFNVQLADSEGAKLIDVKDRYNYAVNNREKYLEIYNNPFSKESVDFVNKAKEPRRFLATVLELGRILSKGGDPTTVPALPHFSFDYVSSANQQKALAIGDPSYMRLANLSHTNDKFDPYVEVAYKRAQDLPKTEETVESKKAFKELEKLGKLKDKARNEMNKAFNKYLTKKQSTKEQRVALGKLKSEIRKAKNSSMAQTLQSLPDIINGLEHADTKKIISDIQTSLIRYDSALKDFNNFRNRKSNAALLDLHFNSFFTREEVRADFRSPSKISDMLKGYGSGPVTVASDIADLKLTDTEKIYTDMTKYHAAWLTKQLFEATEEVLGLSEDLLAFYKIMGKELGELNTPLIAKGLLSEGVYVQKPTYPKVVKVGLQYKHDNPNVIQDKEVSKSGAVRYFPRVAVGNSNRINKRRMTTKPAAAITHLADSQSVYHIADKNAYPFFQVYDEIHNNNGAELYLDMKKAYVEAYANRNVLEELLELNPKALKAKQFYEENLKDKMVINDRSSVLLNPHSVGAGNGYIRIDEKSDVSKTDEELATELLQTLGKYETEALENLEEAVKESNKDKVIKNITRNTTKATLPNGYQQSNKKC